MSHNVTVANTDHRHQATLTLATTRPNGVPTSGSAALDVDATAVFARICKALGDPLRVQLVNLVRNADDGEACLCEIADHVNLAQSTLSHHMRVLVDAGVLTRERRGTWSWYQIRPEAFDTIEQLVKVGGPLRDEPEARSPGRPRRTRC